MAHRSRTPLAIAALAACASLAHAELIYGLTLQGSLVTFDSLTPGSISAGVAVQGLQANETLVGIDTRPATGELFGLGSFNRMYRIDPVTGLATQVGGAAFAPGLNGSAFGFDFNPTVDRIRVTSDADQNLRLNPITGALAAVDGSLAYAAGDVNFGRNANVVHAAYTNNFAGATTTTLYGIDAGTDALVIQSPPNNGVLTTVGVLGTDVTDIGGFDISGATGIAYAVLLDANLSRSTLWTINLSTGAGTLVGQVGGGAIITAMTVVPAPGAASLLALAGVVSIRRRR